MTKIINLFILTFVIFNCNAQDNLKEYYYPISNKKQVFIYKYQDKKDPSRIEYWKITTNPNDNEILTESFTGDFFLYNVFKEKITKKGAELIDYKDYAKDDAGKLIETQATIINKDVYLWNGEEKYQYAVQYKSKYGNEQFIKDRQKKGFEKININDKEYETIKFFDEYVIKILDSHETYEFYQLTFYAKKLGMVAYRRYYPNGTIIELELKEILTEAKFKKLQKGRI